MNERKRRADPNEKGRELRASKKEKLDTKEGKIQKNSSSWCIAKRKLKAIYKKNEMG